MKFLKFIIISKANWLLVFFLLILNSAGYTQIEVVQQRPDLKNSIVTDSVAGFKGGNQLLFEFLENNFLLNDSLSDSKTGKNFIVSASFIVDSVGKLSEVHVNDIQDSKSKVQDRFKAILNFEF